MKVYLILIAIYIIQILVVLAYPYYLYRKDRIGKERTIGDFMDYMKGHDMGGYIPCAFFHYIGVMIVIIMAIILAIGAFFVWIYRNFIKNIRI